MHVWGNIAKSLGCPPGNRKVPGSIQVRFPAGPLWCCCYFLEQETLLTLLQSTQLLKWGPGCLVPTGEAPHLAVTSMGTWEANAQLCMSLIAVEGPGGTLGAHSFTCETWYSLLRVTSPAPGGHACADS